MRNPKPNRMIWRIVWAVDWHNATDITYADYNKPVVDAMRTRLPMLKNYSW